LEVEAAGSGGRTSLLGGVHQDPIRTLWEEHGVYPAIEELDALRKKIIPPGLSYFYAVDCLDENANSSRGSCTKYDSKQTTMYFWRIMRPDDVANYARRVGVYNRRFKPESFYALKLAVPSQLKLAKHVAEDQWPDDFMIMQGSYDAHGDAIIFSFEPRAFMLDVAVIENGSAVSIEVNDILGSRAPNTRLRLAGSLSSSSANPGQPLEIAAGKLAPGERALVPLRIYLAPNTRVSEIFRYRQIASQIYTRIGPKGYHGNIRGRDAPNFKHYAYGPEIFIGGLIVDGVALNLTNPSANYLELTISDEAGSCPYLLWQSPDGDWVRHGKVLDKAPNKGREYTDARLFQGLRSRFRIEEREPEIAFIDQAELVVTLKSGESLALAVDNPRLAALDGEYLRLLWGDAVDLAFSLPKDIDQEDVVESRFSVTGYYLRYSQTVGKGHH
jgi:hypothetical protein